MQKKSTLLRKVASIVLSISMLATLLGGMTISARVNSTDVFAEDFSGYGDATVIANYGGEGTDSVPAWTGHSRYGAGTAKGTIYMETVDAAHGHSAKVAVSHPDKNEYFFGAQEGVSFNYENTDLVKLSFEIRTPADEVPSRQRMELWVGNEVPSGNNTGLADRSFGIHINGSNVRYINAANGETSTSMSVETGRWYKFDAVWNPATHNLKYYVDGVLLADVTESHIKGIGYVYFAGRGNPFHIDNISLTKMDSGKTSWYSEETVDAGETQLSVSLDETPTEDLTAIAERVVVESIDVTESKMLLGTTTELDCTVAATWSGISVNLPQGITSGTAVRITVPDVKTFTGNTVDAIKVYYVKSTTQDASAVSDSFTGSTWKDSLAAGDGLEQFTVADPTWKAEGYADCSVTDNGLALKMTKDPGANSTYAEADLNDLNLKIDDTTEKIVIKYKMMHNPDMTEAEQSNSTTRAIARVFVNGASGNQICGFDIDTRKKFTLYSNTSGTAKSGDAFTEPLGQDGIFGMNEVRIELYPAETTDNVKYYVNNNLVGSGTASQANLTSGQNKGISKIRLINFTGKTGHIVYVDDLEVVKYAYPKGAKSIVFADENGNVLATKQGAAPAGATQLLVNTEGLNAADMTTATATIVPTGESDIVTAAAFADGVYKIDFSDMLLAEKEYTLTVSEAMGGGYTETFVVGTAEAEVGAVKFIDTADGTTELDSLPASGTVDVKVKIKNATQYSLAGKLMLQVFEFDSAKNADVVKEVYILDTLYEVDSAYNDVLCGFSYTIGNNGIDASRLRVIFWDSYNTLKILTDQAEITKPVVMP